MLALMRAAYHKHRLTSTDGEKADGSPAAGLRGLCALAAIGYEGNDVADHVYASLNEIVMGWLLGLRTRRTVLEPDAADRPACREVAQQARWRRPSNGSGSRTPCSSRLWSREPCTRSGSSSCAATRTSSPPARAGGIG